MDDAKGTQLTGKLLSTAGGIVIESDGQILLNPPGRVVLPAGRGGRPAAAPDAVVAGQQPRGGAGQGRDHYLSGGLDWSADYVLLLSADDKTAGIEGWVTLSNYSGTTYNNAALKLVAGEVNRVRQEMDYMDGWCPPRPPRRRKLRPADSRRSRSSSTTSTTCSAPTTIKNNQQKQIGLLTAADVPVKKLFLFDGVNGGDVRVMVEFKNDEESGMGMPLPAGVVRLFKADSKGQAQFVGEDRIEHTPKDEKLRLYTGNAFDVKGEAVQTEYKDLGKGYSASYKVTLKNHKEKEDVVVTVNVPIYGDWSMTASNFDYVKKDANTAEFQIPVPADSEVVLTYSFKVVWR